MSRPESSRLTPVEKETAPTVRRSITKARERCQPHPAQDDPWDLPARVAAGTQYGEKKCRHFAKKEEEADHSRLLPGEPWANLRASGSRRGDDRRPLGSRRKQTWPPSLPRRHAGHTGSATPRA